MAGAIRQSQIAPLINRIGHPEPVLHTAMHKLPLHPPLGVSKGFLWYGLQSIICVVRTTMRQRHTSDIPVQEVHYYLSSLPPNAAKLGAYIRAHWGIENTCHHLLDVTCHEDHCQVRDRTAAHNLTLIREIATKLLKAQPGKSSVKARRKRAGFSPLFRSEIVDPIFHIPHA